MLSFFEVVFEEKEAHTIKVYAQPYFRVAGEALPLGRVTFCVVDALHKNRSVVFKVGKEAVEQPYPIAGVCTGQQQHIVCPASFFRFRLQAE